VSGARHATVPTEFDSRDGRRIALTATAVAP
jgi:hypothetical protein